MNLFSEHSKLNTVLFLHDFVASCYNVHRVCNSHDSIVGVIAVFQHEDVDSHVEHGILHLLLDECPCYWVTGYVAISPVNHASSPAIFFVLKR